MQKRVQQLNRQSKLRKYVRNTLFCISALILLYLFLTSSYIIRRVYLPVLSEKLGIQITARDARFSLFREHLLRFKDLKLSSDEFGFYSKRAYVDVDLRALADRKLCIDSILLNQSEMVISDTSAKLPDQLSLKLSSEKLQIHNAAINDLSIRYISVPTGQFWSTHINELSADSIAPDRINTIKLRSSITYRAPDMHFVQIPVSGSVEFRLSDSFIPDDLYVQLISDQLSGLVFSSELPSVHLHANFHAAFSGDSNEIIEIRDFSVEQITEDQSELKLAGGLVYNLHQRAGDGNLHLDIGNVNPRIAEAFFKHTFVPRDLRFSGDARFTITDSVISTDIKLSGSTKELSLDGIPVLHELTFTGATNGSFDIDSGTILWQDLSAELLTAGKPLLLIGTEGAITFRHNRDSSWHIEKSSDCAIRITVSDFPLAAANQYIPFDFHSGILNMQYNFAVQAEKEQVSGDLRCSISDVSLANGHREITERHCIDINGSFHTDGLENIRSFTIPACTVSQKMNGGSFAEYILNGSYSLDSQSVDLKGTLSVNVCRILQLFKTESRILELCRQLQQDKANTNASKLQTQIHISLPEGKLTFSGDSVISESLELFGPEYKNKRALFSFSGTSDFSSSSKKTTLNKCDLELQDLFHFELNGINCMNQEKSFVKARIHRLTPAFLRKVRDYLPNAPFFRMHETIDRLVFENLQGEFGVEWHNQNGDFILAPFRVKMNQAPDQYGTLELTTPFHGNYYDPSKYRKTRGRMIFNQFSLAILNTIIPLRTQFFLLDSPTDGITDFIIHNQSCGEIEFTTELKTKNTGFIKRGKKIDYGKTIVTGNGLFSDDFNRFKYWNTTMKCFSADESVNGIIKADGQCEFSGAEKGVYNLYLTKCNQKHLEQLVPVFSENLALRDFAADGSLQIRGNDNYNHVQVSTEINIRNADFVLRESQKKGEKNGPVRPLHGKIVLDYTVTGKPERFILNNSFIQLEDQNNDTALHLLIDGTWIKLGEQEHKTTCNIISDGADIYLLKRIFAGGKAHWETLGKNSTPRTEDESVSATALSPAPAATADNPPAEISDPASGNTPPEPIWPFKVDEPKRINLNGFTAILNLDIENWTYTDHIQVDISGNLTAEKNTFRTRELLATVNQSPIKIALFADMSKDDGWEIKADIAADEINAAPVIRALGDDELADKNITGKLNNVKFSGYTKGITLESLEKNLDISLQMEPENFSFPLYQENSINFLPILLTPLRIVPATLELVPGKQVREFLMKGFANQVDILSGRRNIRFDSGRILICSVPENRTALDIKKCILIGPEVRTKIKQGTIDPFKNTIRVDTFTLFGKLRLPITLKGALLKPEAEKENLVKNLLTHNGINQLKDTLNLLSLGLYEHDAAEWVLDDEVPETTDNETSGEQAVPDAQDIPEGNPPAPAPDKEAQK